ncbi:MAG: hypothetical protein WB424_07795 [Terracidiphilus sp.]
MRRSCLALLFLVFCSLCGAQQSLNNDAVIKLIQSGLPDDLVITTINASPGTYDISVDGLIALKSANVSDKVVAAIIAKANAPVKVVPTTPPIRLGLCEFDLDATTKSSNASPLLAPFGVAGISHFVNITDRVQHLYEKTFAEDPRYQVVNSDEQEGSLWTKATNLTKTARINKLAACVGANTVWAAQTGKTIRAVITTNWEVATPGGCTAKFMTSAISSETFEKLPNGGDPAMKSVYLDLSAQDAKKFLENFPWQMKHAGCNQ